MAERAGFEPAVRVIPVRRFSKPVLSTTQPSLRARSRRLNEAGFVFLRKENLFSFRPDMVLECFASNLIHFTHDSGWEMVLEY